GIDHIGACAAVDDQLVCRFRMEDGDRRGRAGDRDQVVDAVIEEGNIDLVVVGCSVDRHGVDLTVADAGRAGKIDGDPAKGQVGPANIVDDDIVRAAKGTEHDSFDIVEIHCDVGDIAEEAHPLAVGGDID